MRTQFVLMSTASCAPLCAAERSVNVTTYHNDVRAPGRTPGGGSTLGTQQRAIGKLFSVAVDGVIYAQPLYCPRQHRGAEHNWCTSPPRRQCVATMRIAHHLRPCQLDPAAVTRQQQHRLFCTDIVPKSGSRHPVIDPVAGPLRRGRIQDHGGYYQYLHALDVRTLARNSMAGQHPGDDGRDGYDASGGYVTFLRVEINAGAVAGERSCRDRWSSHCDDDPYHGWSFLQCSDSGAGAVFNDSPNGAGAGSG